MLIVFINPACPPKISAFNWQCKAGIDTAPIFTRGPPPKMHPVIYLATEVILTVLVIGFSTPYSVIQPIGFVLMTICVFRCIPNWMPYMTRTPWTALVGDYSVTYLYHCLDLALLSRWSFKHGAPISGLLRPNLSPANSPKDYQSHDKDSIRERLVFGIRVTSTFRFVGTQYEVRNTPSVLAIERRDLARRTFGVILISYCLLDFINANNDMAIASQFLTSEKISILIRLHEVTAEELRIRLFTLGGRYWTQLRPGGHIPHLCTSSCQRGHLRTFRMPPSLYGLPVEAYILRRFWELTHGNSPLLLTIQLMCFPAYPVVRSLLKTSGF
ncbi:hypothetical protein P280DRAFT_57220 [Massarina eburnea CBS 473.64]|uniref:Wax synthase domain-containing protein n=1 Tax=Massarina eburnea CBS 473.64 TaxID=1395130 RepID=A0A6A6RWX7_9PLEO|nr:hypothetical protein P280DRAFT_57220 [Massarina eburnea CBS 473.64]